MDWGSQREDTIGERGGGPENSVKILGNAEIIR